MKSLCPSVCVVLVNFFTQSSSCPYTFTLHLIFTRGDLGLCLDFNWVIWTRACQISNIKCCVDKPESQVPSHIYDGEINFANLQNAADDIICVTILYSVFMVSYSCSYRWGRNMTVFDKPWSKSKSQSHHPKIQIPPKSNLYCGERKPCKILHFSHIKVVPF